MAPKNPDASTDRNTLLVSMKTGYGKRFYYAENETAKLFLQLLGRETLTDKDIPIIKQLGFRIVVKAVEL